jgi:hypothetical protein
MIYTTKYKSHIHKIYMNKIIDNQHLITKIQMIIIDILKTISDLVK